ncbi:MAG: hypothetical protein ACQESS_11055 [Bacillota bacterium]
MTNFKKIIIFMFLLLLISAFSSTLVLAQGSYEIPFDKLRTPTELQDIIDTFDRLEYKFSSFKEGEKIQQIEVKFQYQGKEQVGNVKADKIFIESSISESSQISNLTFWLNDGQIVKMVQNEQEIPAVMADSMKDKFLQSIFFPFYNFDELNLEEIASEGKVTRTQEMISGKEIDMIKVESDNLAESGLDSGTVKLADFDQFMMTVGFTYLTLEEAETEYDRAVFEVTEIELN